MNSVENQVKNAEVHIISKTLHMKYKIATPQRRESIPVRMKQIRKKVESMTNSNKPPSLNNVIIEQNYKSSSNESFSDLNSVNLENKSNDDKVKLKPKKRKKSQFFSKLDVSKTPQSSRDSEEDFVDLEIVNVTNLIERSNEKLNEEPEKIDQKSDIGSVDNESSIPRSVSDISAYTELIKGQRKKGNLLRNNLEKMKKNITPPIPKESLEDDAVTTRSVISTISNKGKLETVNQYRLLKFLGQGSFGKVYLCRDLKTKKKYAMKILDKKKTSWKFISKNKTVYDNIINEVNIMKKLDHPNIVKLIEVLDQPDDDTIYIVMEYVGRYSVQK